MNVFARIFKPVVTAFAVSVWFSLPAAAQSADIDQLLSDLANPETENWQQIERQVRNEWTRSGSAAMDLLYQRGQKALQAEDFDVALEHFTALTDHAPDFAEGWNGRATALFNKKLYGPALEDLRRVLALNPQHFGALTGLAVILQELGFEPEALEAWQAVQAIHPHRPEVTKAIEALEKATGGIRI